MKKQLPITMSRLDWARLDRLLNSEPHHRESSLDALRDELDRANIIEPVEMPPDVASMNSTVKFVDDATGANFELMLVYPDAAGTPGTVSVLAPVGSALLGLSVGQSIDWQLLDGRTAHLRVLEIIRQPEAMGLYHL